MSLKNPVETVTLSQTQSIDSHLSSWLTPLVYPLACWGVLPFYFRRIVVKGKENLPATGPIILAPTHRSRWDGLMLGYAAGRWATGRDLRFMVTSDEVKGIQGWFIRQLGGFPVNPRQPAIASLRHGVEILQDQQALVIFPEGGIFQDNKLHPLKQGLARLALQAEVLQPGLGTKIVPISLHYSNPWIGWRCEVEIRIGQPLSASDYAVGSAKQKAQQLTKDLEIAIKTIDEKRYCATERSASAGVDATEDQNTLVLTHHR